MANNRNYQWKLIISFFVAIIVITAPIILFNVNPSAKIISQKNLLQSTSFGPDIIIPNHYDTIQQGINHAEVGDIIFVKSGVYKENIVVDIQGLSIIGENKFTTIIDGGKTTDAVDISAPDVTFEGFTVINGLNPDETMWYISGIKIESSNVIVKGNVITKNRLGLNTGATASNLTIIDNSFVDDGLLLENFEYLKLTKENAYHTITNNTVNGKPLYYFTDRHDFKVPVDAGQIILVNCTNVTMENLYLSDTDFAILLYYSSNCIIENSTVTNTDGEICLIYSDNNIIQNNVATYSLHGICIDFQSKNNIIRYNKVSENAIGISVITASNNNKVYGNTIHNNGMFGVMVTNKSKDNTISNNEIYNNGKIYGNGAGILITDSSNNLFHNNNIEQNKRGLMISSSSDNVVSNNNFRKNKPITAMFIGYSDTTWDHNYWNRARILPKIIFGFKTDGKLPFPWINFDKHPQLKPNEI